MKNRPSKPKLSRNIMANMLLTAALAIGVMGSLWIGSEYSSLKRESEATRARLMNYYMEIMTAEVNKALSYIKYRKAHVDAQLKDSIRNRVSEANTIALNIFNQYQGKRTLPEIQSMVKDALRPIRFNEGRGYYFAFNLQGVEELFADRPEMEGKDMLPVQGARGEFVVRDMLDIVRKDGEGFYEYTWTKPDKEGHFPKIAYVKLFEPFGWVIGTGEYLDDVEHDVQREVIAFIEQLRYRNEDYIFAGQWDGVSISGPAKGENMWDVADSKGVKIVQELIRLAKGGSGYLEYVMPKLEDKRPSPKLSYVVGVPDWEWYVGTGIYIDEIETEIEKTKSAIEQGIRGHLVKIAFVFSAVMVFVALAAWVVSRRTRKDLDSFSGFFRKATVELTEIDPDRMSFLELHGLAHLANDMVKARKQAETALKESEARYRSFWENTGTATLIIEEDTTISMVNAEFEKLSGLPREDIEGKKSWTDFVVPSDLEEMRRYHTERRKAGGQAPRSYEFGLVDSAGKVKHVLNTVAVIPGTTRSLASLIDISALKTIEQELRRGEELYTKLIAAIPDIVVRTDMGGNILFINEWALEVSGYSRAAIEGHNMLDFVAPEDRERVVANMVKMLERRLGPQEYRLIMADGRKVPFEVNGDVLRDEDGTAFGIVNVCRDIAERKRAEDERQKLQAQLLQAQKMESVGRLAGGVAHDFNNMLGVIVGNAELAMMQVDPAAPISKNIQEILNASQRSAGLVRQLLAFARKQTVSPKVIDLNDALEGMLKMLRRLIGEDIDLAWKPGRDLWSVRIDPSQIDQIMANLAVNARDAIAGVGTLTIESRNVTLDDADCARQPDCLPGDYVMLVVSDDGSGMQKDVVDHLFEPFFTTKEIGKGTGLGLATVYGIVKQNEGFIHVSSEPGKGTSFGIYFPRFKGKGVKAPEGEELNLKELPQGTETVLLAEDDRSLLSIVKSILERQGYTVLEARTPTEALGLAEKHPGDVHLLLTDVVMPEMNGRELMGKLRAARPKMKALFMSGYTANVVAHRGILDEGVNFIEKPFSLKSLVEKVREVLEKG